MKRRDFMTLLVSTTAAAPLAASAQSQSKVYRVGLLSIGPAVTENSRFGGSLIRGLVQHGFIPGTNLAFETLSAEGYLDRLPRLVSELVARKVDVIIAFGYPPALAAKQGTKLPVVVFGGGDPVGTGLVASLARPGGNLTGISDVSVEITPKRMEFLKAIAPRTQRIAILWNANDLGMTLRYQAAQAGASALGLSIQPLGVREPDDFDAAFAAMKRDMPDAILMVSDALTNLNRKRVFVFAAERRLPGIYENAYLVHEGGLMSYGPDDDETFGRVAALVDRILKGANPAELPFERPALFKLAINTTTAKAIGLEIPPSLLARADEVVE